jgi:3-hydroxyisobutyrate dehydrogenase-like beta-hydroxyacid dehydrogenase
MYGLGIMGDTMAEALLDHGYKVCGFDIDAKAKKRFKKFGGQFLTHASDVAARADIVIVSVATAKALEQVTQAIVDGQHNRKTKTPPIVIPRHKRDDDI